ncbi:MAG: hypothetical protein GX456_12680 [Verrucomicrobia bacterium]|nr:hypothetical protein [Verrucomicrobiota bacterium]
MKALFVDARPLVAVVNPGDQHEAEARQALQRLAATRIPLSSTEHILDEVATAIARTQNPRQAAE